MKTRNTTWLLSSLLTLLVLFLSTTAPAVHAQQEEEDIAVDLTITSATLDRRTGTVTVTGTVSCSEAATAEVWVNMTQQVGRIFTVQGFGNPARGLACAPEQLTEFTVIVTPYEGEFRPGHVRIRASADVFSCAPETWQCRYGYDFVDTTMRLARR